jgi:nucleoside triphosphate pyrophosphatase
MRLVLASASPRRRELLEAAGFDFETLPVDVDESVRPGESPAAYVRRLAAEKSARAQGVLEGRAGASEHDPVSTDCIVLAADTAVVVDGDILGKPRDAAEAAGMLGRLSGRAHDVMTGISLRKGLEEFGRVESSRVFVAALSADELHWYVGSGEGRDKAGAYAIQGLASRFVTRIEGSYSNVVGLPVRAVYQLLQALEQG